MTHPQPQGELRPTDTAPSSPIPLLRLRGHDRDPIPPEACLVGPDCLVCRWRQAGLLPPAGHRPPTGASGATGPVR